MWINEVLFDGENVKGYLINEPHSLKNIQVGDYVEVPLNHISDWLFAITPNVQKPKGLSRLFSSLSPVLPKAYGGFTIQKMRADMSGTERKEHDAAWQLDFGDFNDIQVVNNQKENPENLIEHPMSKNMKEEFAQFLQQYPDEIFHMDENGLTLLHRETIAGNLTIVQAALDAGADKNIQSGKGKTALDYAKEFKWEHIIPVLEG
jgi:ankyrin repeat protein